MFLKTHRRIKNGKSHCYYSIAENKRTTRGVVQRQVLYLGEINHSQREAWRHAISVFDEDTQTERPLALFPASSPLPTHAEGHGVRVRLDAMELHRPRQWGACWLAEYGKAKRLWLMDRGIPTEEVLAEMRASDPPASYLVGTPKGRLTKYEDCFLEQTWPQVRPGVTVKLVCDEGETYVLARSQDRSRAPQTDPAPATPPASQRHRTRGRVVQTFGQNRLRQRGNLKY